MAFFFRSSPTLAQFNAHTHSIAAPTTDANVVKATGAVANAGHVLDTGAAQSLQGNLWTGAQAASGLCIATCSNNHPGLNPSSVVSCYKDNGAGANDRTDVMRGSGIAKVAAVTAIPAATGVPV